MSANCATWTSERIELLKVASMPAFHAAKPPAKSVSLATPSSAR